MSDAHDLGGRTGIGRIECESSEPVFHHEWERRVFAVTLAAGFLGKWNIDMSRWAREQMPGPEYMSSTYYEHWLFGLERLLVEKGLLSPEELQTGRAGGGIFEALAGVMGAWEVRKALLKGNSARRDEGAPPRFKVGDGVRAHNLNPGGHTRLPRYARGKRGVIGRDHGIFVFPDSNAMGKGEKPQHCYGVRFTLRELWGPNAPPRDSVNVDLWDDHLELE